jgi:hypothetical protein
MNLKQALAEECFEPSWAWFKWRLGLWLMFGAVLIGGAIGAAYWPVSAIALALMTVPISLLIRDAYDYTGQRVALVYFEVEISRGILVASHPTFSLFEVQFDYKQSRLGEWLNYGDAIFRCGEERYVLRSIHNVRGLSRSIALRRAVVLRSLQHQPHVTAFPRFGSYPALQVGRASVLQDAASVIPTKAATGPTIVFNKSHDRGRRMSNRR